MATVDPFQRPIRKSTRILVLLMLGLSISGFGSCFATIDYLQPGAYGVGLNAGSLLIDFGRLRGISFSVWYPTHGEPGVVAPGAPAATDGPYPLIISAHGLGDSPSSLGPIHAHLTSHGFMVAAPDFPGAFGDAVSDLTNDIVEHPADVSLLIDAALGVNTQFPAELAGLADPTRVGMMGLSFGGLATYLTSFDRELRDDRIKIAMSLAGGAGDSLQPLFFDFVHRPLPLLLLHGTADALIDYETSSRSVLQNANWPTVLISFDGGSHVGYIEGVPVLPGTHPDTLACLFFPEIDPTDPEVGIAFQYLTNRVPDTGFSSPGPAPLPCVFGAQNLPWMPTSRQLILTKVSLAAFAIAHFGDTPAKRIDAHTFLRRKFAAENGDVTLETKPFSWDWLGTLLE
jgi:dienelactone hydrolase